MRHQLDTARIDECPLRVEICRSVRLAALESAEPPSADAGNSAEGLALSRQSRCAFACGDQNGFVSARRIRSP